MYFATCPRCVYAFAFDLPDGRTRVSCPQCLRTFDPFEPIPEKPDPVKQSEAIAGDADLLVDPADADAAEPPDLDLTKSDEDDDDADDALREDFEQGL